MESILENFGIKPVLLAAQVVNFLILLFLLRKFLYGPILKVLQQRKDKIAQSLKNAEEIEKKLTQTEEDREKRLEKASDEAKAILEEATKSASQIIEEAHQKAATDIEQMVKKSEEAMKLERERMQQEIRGELADLVVTAMQKVTGKILTGKDQRQIVEKTVKDL